MKPPVLIVGSYPPIPVAGAPVTLEEVRRAWSGGEEVTVVSPRLSGAHLTVPVYGLLAGRRLDHVRRYTGTSRLVLVAEPGLPLPAGSALQVPSALVLARAMRGFEHVRLVRAGAWESLSSRAWAILAAAAHEVAEAAPGPSAPGVTPLGPPEVSMAHQPRRLAGIVVRRVLGPRAPAVRARLGPLRARLRSR